ncbi:MAG: hypothetical protein JRI23_13240 [Deltaproteobacteria bacterium]|jgi:hypothetical protein|nr:hypothetical protein [Deltaproteobacteria bacterium]MBW2532688.1 hypothetical protein [Deltaproteobacteria bacterium]
MKLHRKIAICVLAGALVGPACGSPPPPEPPKPAPKPKPKPKPPPPPKCESLEEGCKADAETRATISTSDFRIQPPESWIYAQQDRALVTQVDDGGPVLALTVFTPESDKKALAKQRTEALNALAEVVEITLPKKPISFDRPDQKDEVAGLKMQYWQREQAARGEGSGSLLVLMADLDGRAMLGMGYVPDDDKSEADRLIFEALQTVKKEGGDDEGEAGDDEAEGDS